MSGNTNESNIGQAHGLDQANHAFPIYKRTCCTCGYIYRNTTPRFQPSICFRCNHNMCEMCTETYSENDLRALDIEKMTDEERRAFAELYIPVSTPPTPSLLATASTPEPNRIQNLNGHEDLDTQEEPRNEVNSGRDQGMQSHVETSEKQQLPPIRGRKKRKLNMVKCQRCREDKKGCIWKSSDKCDRCIEKGLLCSEGTRVTRPRKLASRYLSPIHTDISHSVDSGVFEDRLKKWAFLKNYHKMMTMAVERLEKLEKDMTSHFGWYSAPLCRGPKQKFKKFVLGTLPQALEQLLGELLNNENGLETFPARFLTAGQSLAWLIGSTDMMCRRCCPESHKPMVDQAMKSVDVCGKFLLQLHTDREHPVVIYPPRYNYIKELQRREIERSVEFAFEIPRQAGAILESIGFSGPATYSRSLSLYCLDSRQSYGVEWQSRDLDCLKRTPLHRLLDQDFEQYPYTLDYMRSIDIVDIGWWNSQDILGRSPLHMICQFQFLHEGSGKMEKILELGGNPGLSTVHGSTPLHYAAAKGHLKICKLLMKHKDKFKIGEEDRRGMTALAYAVHHKRQDVVDLLIDHYKQDGLSKEIEAALEFAKGLEFRFALV